jgi:glycosyltransferase involved in cell wall biosynthesis
LKVLFFTRHTPLPTDDGAGSYVFDILRFLREKGLQVEVLWFQPPEQIFHRGWYAVPTNIGEAFNLHLPGGLEIGRLRLFPARIYLPWKARVLNWLKTVLKAAGLFSFLRRKAAAPSAGGEPPFSRDPSRNWMALPTADEMALARRYVERVQPDIVIANYCWMNELFACVAENRARRISLTVDVAHHRAAMLARMAGAGAGETLTMPDEQRLLGMADLIVAISEEDAKVFQKMLPDHPIVVTPKAVVTERLSDRVVPCRCLFVGSDNQPNQEGLTWFLDSVWPLVLQERPNAHLQVCGSVGRLFTKAYPQVVFSGKVPNLRDAYAEAEIVIVPLLSGSGMKIKLVEACAFGKACVTTSVGLQGLPFLAEVTLCADDAAGFAMAACRLLRDANLRRQLESASLLAAETHLSRSESYDALWRWIVRPVATKQRGLEKIAEAATA